MKRRDLFKMAGVTAGAATLSACTASTDGKILGDIVSREEQLMNYIQRVIK